MNHQTIQFANRGGIGIMTLNRPERLNAINRQMIDETKELLSALEKDDSLRVLVLQGAGRGFCSGFDLKDGAATGRTGIAEWRPVIERDFDFIMQFWHFPKPTIAAVHGAAIAAGCEMAMACDITIADATARFGEPELRFGSGIVALLMPWMAGPKKAKEWLLSGFDRIGAAEALSWGLINRAVPAGEHVDAALKLARDIAVNDRQKVAMVKLAINRSLDIMGFRDALAMGMEMEVQIEAMDTPEGREFDEIVRRDGLKAALAWRDARFDRT